jgi:hypothetical protein
VVQITRGATTVRQMTYDNAGNLLTDGGNAYTYNNRNRMASATIGAIVWNYTYNGKEQLAIRAKVSPAATTHFIHDLLQELGTALFSGRWGATITNDDISNRPVQRARNAIIQKSRPGKFNTPKLFGAI